MTILNYISENWGFLVLLLGMATVLYSDTYLEKRMIMRIAQTLVMLFAYSVSSYIETYLGNQTELSPFRLVLSAVDYALVPFILVSVIMIMYPMQRLYLYIPALMNAVLCFISIPTEIVFRFTQENTFGRGPLGFIPFFINALYLVYLIINLFYHNRFMKEEFFIMLYMSATAVTCLILPLFSSNGNTMWFTITIAIDVLLYYVFLLQQFSKRDPLTGLLNRQTYYSDSEKYANDISAVITLDMNGLKKINDNEGHLAGDTALKTLADCFWKASQHNQRVYRIGGDEFVILGKNITEDDVRALIERIRKETSATPYHCSIGFAMKQKGKSIEQLYVLADEMLYAEKQRYYAESGIDRRK